jgi:hypothetical protein
MEAFENQDMEELCNFKGVFGDVYMAGLRKGENIALNCLNSVSVGFFSHSSGEKVSPEV